MSIFIDTNVLLDVMLRRDDFYPASRAVFDIIETNNINLSPSEYITQFRNSN